MSVINRKIHYGDTYNINVDWALYRICCKCGCYVHRDFRVLLGKHHWCLDCADERLIKMRDDAEKSKVDVNIYEMIRKSKKDGWLHGKGVK